MAASCARRILWSAVLLCAGCSVLIGESFDGYSAAPRDAGRDAAAGKGGGDAEPPSAGEDAAQPEGGPPPEAGAGAGGAGDSGGAGGEPVAGVGSAGMDAAVSGGTVSGASGAGEGGRGSEITKIDDGDDAGTAGVSGSGGTPGPTGAEVRILPGDVCAPVSTAAVNFDDPSDKRLQLSGPREVPVDPTVVHTFSEGSPAAGALALEATYGAPYQAIKLGWELDPSASLACVSVRVKIAAQPDNVDLVRYPAGWFLWAIDANGCFAQSEKNHNWSYDLDRAGIWYELSASTNKLVQSGCNGATFAPQRIALIGLGLTTPASSWHARFFVDAFSIY